MASRAPTWTAPPSSGSSGSRSHSKRASITCSTSLHGARVAIEPRPPRSAITSSTASRSRSGPSHWSATVRSLSTHSGHGGLAGEAVERRPEQLHDAQQGLGVRHVPQAPLAPVGVALGGGGLALGLGPGAQADDPAAEAGDDAGLAARVVPARGARRDVRARAAPRTGRGRTSGTPSRPAAPARGSGRAAAASAPRARSAAAARGGAGAARRPASSRSVKSGA